MKGSWHILSEDRSKQAKIPSEECFKMDRKSLLAILPHPILCLQRQVGRQSFEYSDKKKAGREEHPNGVTLCLFTLSLSQLKNHVVKLLALGISNFKLLTYFHVIIIVRITFGTIAKVCCTSLSFLSSNQVLVQQRQRTLDTFFTCDHVLLHVGHTCTPSVISQVTPFWGNQVYACEIVTRK